jgi:hypothetical protein
VEISLLMCVRHSYLSLSENHPRPHQITVFAGMGRERASYAVHLQAMFRSSPQGKSR